MIAKETGGKLKLNLKKSSKNRKRQNEEQWENKDNNKTGEKKNPIFNGSFKPNNTNNYIKY